MCSQAETGEKQKKQKKKWLMVYCFLHIQHGFSKTGIEGGLWEERGSIWAGRGKIRKSEGRK